MIRLLQAVLVCTAFAATQAHAQVPYGGSGSKSGCKRVTVSLNSGQSLKSYTCKWKYGCTCSYLACRPPHHTFSNMSCLTSPG